MSSNDITDIWNCTILNSNYKKYISLNEQLNDLRPIDTNLSKPNLKTLFESMPQSTVQEYISIIESGSFYDEKFERLSEKYKFPKENLQSCKSLLELGAFSYLAENSKIYTKSFLKAVEQKITPLINQANKLKYYTDKLLELGEAIDIIFEEPSVIQLLEDTTQNLQQLSQIREQLRNSWIAETSKVGVKAPVGNPGLKPFIATSRALWTVQMNRNFTQTYDGINGRKQFLEFLIDCLEPLDPSLKFDTVDNALKKQLANWKKE